MGLFDLFRVSAIRDLTPETKQPEKIKSPTGQDVWGAEASFDWKNPWGIGSLGLLTNEDDLAGKHGLEVYRQMEERDAQVRFCLSLKKLATLSQPYEIHPADVSDEDDGTKAKAKKPAPFAQEKPDPEDQIAPEVPDVGDTEDEEEGGDGEGAPDATPGASSHDADKEEAERQARFIRTVFEEMEGDLKEDLSMILNAFRDGFSVTEKNFQVLESGEFKGYIGLKNLKTRRADYWKFATDIHGNLLGLYQTIAYEPVGEPWPTEKFIIFSHNRQGKDGLDIYGRSDLRPAWRYYRVNDFVHRYMGVYLEKYAMPTAVGKAATTTARAADRTQVLTVLKRLMADTAITLPPGWEVDLMEAKRQGSADYCAAMDWNNKMMQRAILLGGDTASSSASPGAQAGSYAMSKTHMELLVQSISWSQRILEEAVMGEQVIRQLIDFNFPEGRRFYPTFKFKSPLSEDRKAMGDMIVALIGKGLVDKGEPWIREFLDLPSPPKVMADRLADEMENPPAPPPQLPTTGKPTPQEQVVGGGPGEPEPKPKEKPEGFRERARKAAFAQALKRVDFAEIKKRLDMNEEEAVADLKKIILRMAEKYAKDVAARRIIEDKLAAKIKDLDLAYKGEIKETMSEWLIKLFAAGGRDAKKELLKVKVSEPTITASAKPTLEGAKLTALMKDKAFRIAGVLSQDILADANQVLATGLEKGFSNARVMNDLAGVFQEYAGDAGLANEDGKLLTPNRLETIVRTNFTSAYNLGRRDLFLDPDLKGFVKGVEFSAILDDRTTDICEELDGKVFEASDIEGVERFTPPLHYNCRSILVPITEYEAQEEPFTPMDAEAKGRAEGLVQSGFVEERKAHRCRIHTEGG